jgi:hypothetical protein
LKPRLEVYLRDKLKRQSEPKIDLGFDEEFRVLLKKEMGKEGEKLAKTLRRKKYVAPDPITDPDLFFRRYDLLLKMGGELIDASIVFGDQTSSKLKRKLKARAGGEEQAKARSNLQLTFKPGLNGEMTVGFLHLPWPDALKAALNMRGRGLWDKDKAMPGGVYQAIENATGIERRLAAIIEGIAKEEGLETLQKEMPDLRWIHSALANLLECLRNRKAAKRAGLASEIYSEFAGRARPNDSQFFSSVTESGVVNALKNGVLDLALSLQRPPTKAELRHAVGWTKSFRGKARWRLAEFNDHLSDAGLGWLPTDLKLKKLGL